MDNDIREPPFYERKLIVEKLSLECVNVTVMEGDKINSFNLFDTEINYIKNFLDDPKNQCTKIL